MRAITPEADAKLHVSFVRAIGGGIEGAEASGAIWTGDAEKFGQMATRMSRLHSRLDRMRAKVREMIAVEVPGVPAQTLQASVCLPYPEDDGDLVFFYGEGVVTHADFDYGTSRLSDLWRDDGINTTLARVTRRHYEEFLEQRAWEDQPERRLAFLVEKCGGAHLTDTIVSCPLFSPAVVSLTLPGTQARSQFLVI